MNYLKYGLAVLFVTFQLAGMEQAAVIKDVSSQYGKVCEDELDELLDEMIQSMPESIVAPEIVEVSEEIAYAEETLWDAAQKSYVEVARALLKVPGIVKDYERSAASLEAFIEDVAQLPEVIKESEEEIAYARITIAEAILKGHMEVARALLKIPGIVEDYGSIAASFEASLKAYRQNNAEDGRQLPEVSRTENKQ